MFGLKGVEWKWLRFDVQQITQNGLNVNNLIWNARIW